MSTLAILTALAPRPADAHSWNDLCVLEYSISIFANAADAITAVGTTKRSIGFSELQKNRADETEEKSRRRHDHHDPDTLFSASLYSVAKWREFPQLEFLLLVLLSCCTHKLNFVIKRGSKRADFKRERACFKGGSTSTGRAVALNAFRAWLDNC